MNHNNNNSDFHLYQTNEKLTFIPPDLTNLQTVELLNCNLATAFIIEKNIQNTNYKKNYKIDQVAGIISESDLVQKVYQKL